MSNGESEPICGETVASCICILPPGHDTPHECNCDGSWSGKEEDGSFRIHSLPQYEGAREDRLRSSK